MGKTKGKTSDSVTDNQEEVLSEGSEENKQEKLKKSVALAIKKINDRKGAKGNKIFKMGERVSKVDRIKTGITLLDNLTGGGIPRGRFTQIAGPDKVGKTSLLYAIIAAFQAEYPDGEDGVCLFIDREGTYDEERAIIAGCDPSRIYVLQPDTAEEAFEDMHDIIPSGIKLIVLDSVPMLLPGYVMDGDIGKQDMCPIARFLNSELPKLEPKVRRHNVAVVLVNQVRDNVGMLGWGETTHLPGGRQLRHVSSLILRMARKEWVKKSDEVLGMHTKVKIESSKVCPPNYDCQLNFIFEAGFVEDHEEEETLKRIRKAHLARNKVEAEQNLIALKNMKKEIEAEDDSEEEED